MLRSTGWLLLSLALFACGRTPTEPNGPSAQSVLETPTATGSGPTQPGICTKGRIEGLWIKDTGSETEGRMEAAWIGRPGDTLGMLAGRFWMDSTSLLLHFEGAVSGAVLPVVLYEVSGTWVFTDPRLCPLCGTGTGAFAGRWRESQTGRRGRLSGVWGDLFLPFVEREMPLSGRWSAPCKIPYVQPSVEVSSS